MINKSRNQSLDVIKIVAMIGVMILHTTLAFDNYDNIIGRAFFSYAGISMPLFFMVSGFLMIGKDLRRHYLLYKVGKILRFSLIICVFWWLAFGDHTFWGLLRDTYLYSFIQKGALSHFWYFGSIIILYIFLPLINNLLRHIGYYLFFLFILYLIISFVFILNITGVGERNIWQSFRLWNWSFYFLMGGLLKYCYEKGLFESYIKPYIISHHRMAWGGEFVLLLIYPLMLTVLSPYLGKYSLDLCFGSTFCVISSIAVFVALISSPLKSSRVVDELSSLFLPVYVFHLLTIRFVLKFDFSLFGYVAPIIEIMVVICSTIVFSWILMKIPYVKKVFSI